MKRVYRIFFVLVGLILVSIILFYSFISEPLPKGKPGEEAEILAHLMLDGLNRDAYEAIRTIKWTYQANHHFTWNKERDSVLVKWKNKEVAFCTKTLEGIGKVDGRVLTGDKNKQAVEEAWRLFANDSFWLVAPYKILDPGTVRSVVKWEGRDCLLVTYTSGGVTPGDSYLWILDDQFRPVAWKFWTRKIPVGGLKFTWEGWVEKGGAWFASVHSGLRKIEITNLEVAY